MRSSQFDATESERFLASSDVECSARSNLREEGHGHCWRLNASATTLRVVGLTGLGLFTVGLFFIFPERKATTVDNAEVGLWNDWDMVTTTPQSPGYGSTTQKIRDFRVVYEGTVDIREWRESSAKSIGLKEKCAIVHGKRQGDWLKLEYEHGYLPMLLDDAVVLKELPFYAKIARGKCGDISMFPVTDASTCEKAAKILKLADTTVSRLTVFPSPEGCFFFSDKLQRSLFFADNSPNVGNGATDHKAPICSSYEHTTACLPITTTTTTTWGWPSMLCFSIIQARRDEADLLKAQLNKHIGIFGCDTALVFSSIGSIELADDVSAIQIHNAGGRENMSGEDLLYGEDLFDSWTTSNSSISPYMKAWQLISQSSRLMEHNWIVKVSTDTVFFPERLRGHLKTHTVPHERSLFFASCRQHGELQLRNPIEVISRNAIDKLLHSGTRCQDELGFRDWDEGTSLQNCLEILEVGKVFDQSLLADKDCLHATCWDKAKIAFRDNFHDIQSWFDCWGKSTG